MALFLGIQTVGAVLSTALWGWWGDHLTRWSGLGAVFVVSVVAILIQVLVIYILRHGKEEYL